MDSSQAQIDSSQTRRQLAEKFAVAARLYAEARRSEAAGRAFGEHVEAHRCGWQILSPSDTHKGSRQTNHTGPLVHFR